MLLLDEPTSTLPQPDVERLFSVLRSLAAQGVTLIYISHRMEELYSLCDSVTILRDGRNAASFTTAESKPADVVTAMVGKSLEGSIADAALRGERSPRLGAGRSDRVLLSATDLGEDDRVSEVNLELYAGEVLGISGLIGSGQSELAGLLAGARRKTAGTIRVDEKSVIFSNPRDAIRRGIGLLPQDRKAQGFIPDMSVAGNITLASLPMFSRMSIIDGRKEKQGCRRDGGQPRNEGFQRQSVRQDPQRRDPAEDDPRPLAGALHRGSSSATSRPAASTSGPRRTCTS